MIRRKCTPKKTGIGVKKLIRYGELVEAESGERTPVPGEHDSHPELRRPAQRCVGIEGSRSLELLVRDYVDHLLHHLRHIGIDVGALVSTGSRPRTPRYRAAPVPG